MSTSLLQLCRVPFFSLYTFENTSGQVSVSWKAHVTMGTCGGVVRGCSCNSPSWCPHRAVSFISLCFLFSFLSLCFVVRATLVCYSLRDHNEYESFTTLHEILCLQRLLLSFPHHHSLSLSLSLSLTHTHTQTHC